MQIILQSFEALPDTDINRLLAGRRALLLAPHPDDESLGCGGFIAAASALGLAPAVVIVTDGAASHPGSHDYPPARLREIRAAEVRDAVRILGLPDKNLFLLNVPDGAAPSRGPGFAQEVARLRDIATSAGCGLVIGPWAGDGHPDHIATAQMAAAVAKTLALPLLSYPVWGWLRGPADRLRETRSGGFRLNIAEQRDRKRAAIAAHRSQCGALIQDSPVGFTLPQNLLDACQRDFEVFIA